MTTDVEVLRSTLIVTFKVSIKQINKKAEWQCFRLTSHLRPLSGKCAGKFDNVIPICFDFLFLTGQFFRRVIHFRAKHSSLNMSIGGFKLWSRVTNPNRSTICKDSLSP